ncbi:MAG: DinB family protein [Bacteroidota bacterium]|nr:DinB family protein [Bacteroidota bacterium]
MFFIITFMLIEDFNQTLDTWIKELEKYSFTQLSVKPSPTSWSIGQVYMHLIGATSYFIKQMQICASTNDHAEEETSVNAKAMFLNNAFPDAILEGPPSNADTPPPVSKEQLTEGLNHLKDEINKTAALVSKSQYKGKTKHFGLGYFNANEWMQFAEMHLRHHLRQKKRVDDYIKI